MSVIRALGVGFVISAIAASAAAQQYRTKNITMLVPYAAGGPTDTVARVLARSMAKPLGRSTSGAADQEGRRLRGLDFKQNGAFAFFPCHQAFSWIDEAF